MITKRFFIICTLLAVSFIFTTCSQDEIIIESTNIVKVGALLPLSGSGSSTGESVNAALLIALGEINVYLTEINAGYKLELTVADTKSDSLTAILEYQKLRSIGIDCMIGPCISANVAAVKPLADRDGVLLISPASVASSLSLPDDNVFRLVPDMAGQAEAMTALLNDDGIQVVLPVVRDDVWGQDLLEALTTQFLQYRKGVVAPILYDPSTTDFSSVAASLSEMNRVLLQTYAANQIGIYMLSFNEGTQILHLAAADTTLDDVRWYGNSGYAENKTLLSDNVAAMFAMNTGLSNPAFGYDLAARSKWEPLLNELQSELGRKPEIYALVAYDALWLITHAYLSTGPMPANTTLKAAFVRQADDYFGATGWTTLNDNGDRAYSMYDFWGIRWFTNDFVWTVVARYDNATKELTRLR